MFQGDNRSRAERGGGSGGGSGNRLASVQRELRSNNVPLRKRLRPSIAVKWTCCFCSKCLVCDSSCASLSCPLSFTFASPPSVEERKKRFLFWIKATNLDLLIVDAYVLRNNCWVFTWIGVLLSLMERNATQLDDLCSTENYSKDLCWAMVSAELSSVLIYLRL